MLDTYRAILEEIACTRSSSVTVFADFCRIAACTLAAGLREEEYLETIKPYTKDELIGFSRAFALLIEDMEARPFTDLLGPYYTEISSKSSAQARGEFYTPPPVCELMTKMVCDPAEAIAKGKLITVNEPACGSGGTVLALAKQFSPIIQGGDDSHVGLLRATCQDISPVAVDMCYINTTLWGVPALMIWGDTLRMTINKKWPNVHWLRVGEDQRQALEEVSRLSEQMPNAQERKEDVVSKASESTSGDQVQIAFRFDVGNSG